ncbi:MAG: DedA family protein [Acidimicrobiia bacterium]|nr:DedA family protein [Acidimicrobiia bacterium]
MFGDLFDRLADLSGSPWFLLAVFAIALLDSVIPVVPSETMVIIGGVAAGQGNQILSLVIAAGAIGAFLGDNLAYQLGAKGGPLIRRTLFRGEKGARRLDAAGRQLRQRGGLLLITGRFIPGGRTALTISSGLTAQPRRRFALFVGLAVTIWATYAALLGFIGGKNFEDNHTVAFLFAFGAAVSMTVLIELGRAVWHRTRPAPQPALD